MFEEILEPGKKIKAIRKKLKVTQDKITKTFTKSQVSKVENGAKLTIDMAREVVECTREIGERKGIKIDITVEELMKNTNNQVIENVYSCYEDLKRIDNVDEFENALEELEILIDNYLDKIGQEVRFEIYNLVANKFFIFKKFNNCETYLLKCVYLSFLLRKNELLSDLVLTLTRVYLNLGKFQSVVIWGEYILVTEHIAENSLKKIRFNVAKAYHELSKEYDENYIKNLSESIKTLNILQQNFHLTDNEKSQSDILLANCYVEKNEFKEAEKIYIKIMRRSKDELSKILAYANLAYLYYKKEDFKKAKTNIEKVIKYIDEKGFVFSIEIEFSIWYVAILIFCNLSEKNYDFLKIETYFRKAIKAAEGIENVKAQIKAYKEFIRYCINNKKDSNIIATLTEMYEKINTIKDREILDVFIDAAEYYRKINTKIFLHIFNMIFNITINLEKKK